MSKPKGGMSPEDARLILSKNPALRNQGKDTNWVLARANKAWNHGAAAELDAKGFFDAVSTTRANLRKEEKAITEQIKKLEAARVQAKEIARVHLFAWIEEHDAELKKHETRETMEDEADFLAEVGFSEAAYRKK